MSKLSFRARQLDAYKSMPVYRSEEIPEVTDVAAINRAVPQMPTGMEKDEETEHHLQRALSAQQVYGTAEALVIPVPEIEDVHKDYDKLYSHDYKLPKQYIHAQSYMDQEIPDYDMDSEDENWLGEQSRRMEITALKFEEMIDRLEKCSGQQVVTLPEAKLLLKEDDDLIITVYDYWLNKRLKNTPRTLLPTVKTEKRDGSTTNNPYVAFRRRTEKMQTRKNRKNDEVSYEKMLKLRRDLQRAVTMLEMVKKREKYKKELLQLSIEIMEKRYEMEDFNGSNMAHAEAQKCTRPVFYPLYEQPGKETVEPVRKPKRKYEKRKHKVAAAVPQYHSPGDVNVIDYGSTEEEVHSGGSPSDQEDDSHPDGIYAFRRKKLCSYHAPLEMRGNWPWTSRQSGGFADRRYRYTLATVDSGPENQRCLGYARRRRGRGGRVIFDRAYGEQKAGFWDRVLEVSLSSPCKAADRGTTNSYRNNSVTTNKRLDASSADPTTSNTTTFRDFIEENKWTHFAPIADYDSTNALFSGELADVSSNDLADSIIDPVLDVTPAGEPPPAVHLRDFNSLVTAPSAAPPEDLLHHKPPPPQSSAPPTATTATVIKSEPSVVARVGVTSASYDEHQSQLRALKTEQSAQRPPSVASQPPAVGGTAVAQSCGRVSKINSKEAALALSALVNGSPAARGNGIHHLVTSVPTTTKIGIKKVDLLSSSNQSTAAQHNHKTPSSQLFPLTPSSECDVAEPAHLSVSAELTGERPGESGDAISSHSLIVRSDKEYSESAGLTSIPEVGSTMEVT